MHAWAVGSKQTLACHARQPSKPENDSPLASSMTSSVHPPVLLLAAHR